MSEDEKEKAKIKLLFLVDVILLIGVIVMLFKLVETNNEMTVWLLEHGRIK